MTEQPDRTPDFIVGDAAVYVDEGLLQSRRGEVRLEPKVMAVLVALAREPGQVVSRDRLLSEVWGQTVVSDDALARCIYQIRHEVPPLLANGHGRVIETLRKRGYRLTVPVTSPGSGSSADPAPKRPRHTKFLAATVVALAAMLIVAWAAGWRDGGGESTERINSIAVLPFLNLTGDEKFEYLADGFSEQLSHVLANVDNLKVAARTSAFYFKDRPADIPDIAERLNVGALLEGSIRRQGAQIRVTAQLIRSDGFHIWSREYDRPLAATVQLQSEIAEQIAVELGLTQASEANGARHHSTENYAAYDAYLRGRLAQLRGREAGYESAISFFQQAVELDSDFALAYSGLADSYSFQISDGPVEPDSAAKAAEAAIERALQLDPELAEAHASQGLYLFVTSRYPEAEAPLRRAIELNPNYVNAHTWLGLDLVYQDRFTEAIAAYQQAQRLNPLDVAVNRNLGANLLLAGRADEGLLYLRTVQELKPEDLLNYRLLASWNLSYGRFEQALAWAEAGLAVAPDDARLLTHLGKTYAHLGVWDAAREALAAARASNPEDVMMLEGLLSSFWASGDTQAVRDLLVELGSEDAPLGSGEIFGKARILLRWLMILALDAGRPQDVIELAHSLGTEKNLTCGAFGFPGPKMFWAHALHITGQYAEAETMSAECVEDADRVLANGGTYPAALYRSALSHLLAGEDEAAADAFQMAVDMGWRGYWLAWTDPLWKAGRDAAPFAGLFSELHAGVEAAREEVLSGDFDIR